MSREDIPNLISILRIFLVVPIIGLLLYGDFALAMWLFAVAGISDGLDGYLAKRNGWGSRLGSILDPIADKVLLVSTYVALGWLELIPFWLVVAVIGRDLIIVLGAVAFHYYVGRYEMEPSLISKANTVVQIVYGVLVVFMQAVPVIDEDTVYRLGYVVLVTTVLSGATYVVVWGRRAMEYGRKAHQ